MEHLENLRNLNYIDRLSFSESLVKWNFSGSKAAHTLDSISRASGSITTMKNFFKTRAVEKSVCTTTTDIEIFSDNTQKKGRTS